MQTPFISLCMIVKNEANFIEQCLKSVKGLVDELIVVAPLVNGYTLPSAGHVVIEEVVEHTVRPGSAEDNRLCYRSLGIDPTVHIHCGTVMHQQPGAGLKVEGGTPGYH